MSKRLTDAAIRALPIPDKGQKLYADDIAGFAVRISQGGSKAFILTVGAERQRITLGRYPLLLLADARQKAIRILRDRELGIEYKPSPRFEQVHREYLDGRDGKRPATIRSDTLCLRPFLALSQRKIAEITSDELRRILDSIHAPITRLHSFYSIRNLFRFALKRGYVNRNPLDRFDAPKSNPPRERVLSDDELHAVWQTATAYGWPTARSCSSLSLPASADSRWQSCADHLSISTR